MNLGELLFYSSADILKYQLEQVSILKRQLAQIYFREMTIALTLVLQCVLQCVLRCVLQCVLQCFTLCVAVCCRVRIYCF